MNFRASSAGLGLTALRWNAFIMAATSAKLIPIVPPSFVVAQITTTLGAEGMAVAQYKFIVNGSRSSPAVIPAWCVPGAGVSINVTVGGVPIVFSGIVKDIDTTSGLYFTISPSSNQQAMSITTAWTNQNLDAIATGIVNSVTLLIQCQKAMLSVASNAGGNVTIAPVADVNGANPNYTVTLTAGGSEYEITAPFGAKFDLADWFVQSSASTVNLQIRFL